MLHRFIVRKICNVIFQYIIEGNQAVCEEKFNKDEEQPLNHQKQGHWEIKLSKTHTI